MNPAVYALLGSLIGGLVAGTFSFLIAWQTRAEAASRATFTAWMVTR